MGTMKNRDLLNQTITVPTSTSGFSIYSYEFEHIGKKNHWISVAFQVLQTPENQVNDIILYIMGDGQLHTWFEKCIRDSNSYLNPNGYFYTSGKVASNQYRFQMDTYRGVAHFMFDNRYSTFTSKRIAVRIHEEWEDDPTAIQGMLVKNENNSQSTNKAKSPLKQVRYSSKVFIVHGRDQDAKVDLANLLERLDLEPIILHDQANEGKTLIEKFEANASDVGFAFVLFTPDDMGGEAGEPNALRQRARQNVILELGYFLGKLGRKRVCCLHKGNVELPSDIHGIVYLKYDGSVKERASDIISELKKAGYKVGIKK